VRAATTFAQIAAPTPTASTTPGSAQARATAIAYAPPTPQAISARTRILLQPRPRPLRTPPPTAPTVLSASVGSPSQINLSWTASTDKRRRHRVSDRPLPGTGCTTFAQFGTSTITSFQRYRFGGVDPLSYRVRATDGSGNSVPTRASSPPHASGSGHHRAHRAGRLVCHCGEQHTDQSCLDRFERQRCGDRYTGWSVAKEPAVSTFISRNADRHTSATTG